MFSAPQRASPLTIKMPVGDGSVEHAHVDVVVADGAHVGEGVVVVEVSTFRSY